MIVVVDLVNVAVEIVQIGNDLKERGLYPPGGGGWKEAHRF